ncbi:MAG TPA: prenyltransferase/squalene oxidase repeat-containing protein [Candidatus Angelobacter sp.]|nr:prenyltransferase/squalene oxidase repeat-containing protein [Candidatus Angelobacter sp.]
MISNALKWLDVNQNLDGSYGADPQYIPHWAGAAAYALWLNGSSSPKASKSYSWVVSQMDNSSSGVWYEADIAGEILYSVAVSGNLGLLRNSSDYRALDDFQQSNGGFAGFAEPPSYAPVASAVDTDMALWGLIHARAVNASSQEKATSYLFSLQNTTDGSFALTSNTVYSSFESLAPDPISLTALTLIVLKDASYASSDSRISRGLDYLERAVSTSFKSRVDPSNSTGHVYASSLAAIAFNDYGRTSDAVSSTSFIVTKQNADGGFHDEARGSTGSNALDTAWAAIALQLVAPAPEPTAFLPQLITFGIIAGIVALAVIVGVVVYLVRRNKTQTQVKNL